MHDGGVIARESIRLLQQGDANALPPAGFAGPSFQRRRLATYSLWPVLDAPSSSVRKASATCFKSNVAEPRG